jgi:biopolymer transport protein TolR
MARRSFLKRGRKSTEMTLQITAMADIFTVILIFLLKSYSVGALEVTTPKGLQLPQAMASLPEKLKALKVEISENTISVEGKAVSSMEGFAFNSSDVSPDGTSRKLVAALEGTQDGKILVIADQRAPFETIRTVLASAAARGYTDVKLAVSHVE